LHADKDIWSAVGIEKNIPNWFRITVLHVWMVSSRLRTEHALRQEFIDRFFENAEQRLFDAEVSLMAISKTKREWNQNYLGSIIAYDEGITSNDQILAAALLRNFFIFNTKATHLATMVQYVRKEVSTINETNEEALKLGFIKFGNPIKKINLLLLNTLFTITAIMA